MEGMLPLAFDPSVTRGVIGHELDLVRGAIAMVAASPQERVTVGGLVFGEQVLAQLAEVASAQGVTLRPIWRAAESGCDLAVIPNG